MSLYPPHLLKVIDMLKKLPGVGTKSAERFAFQLLTWPPHELKEIASLLHQIPQELTTCASCGCLQEPTRCRFCTTKVTNKLCIISSPKDAFAIDATHEYQGLYHVLDNLISPLDGIGPESIGLNKLQERIEKHLIEEIIIALDSTVEGDATSLYLKSQFTNPRLKISRLAFGIPLGSSIDYVDGGTLARAFSHRACF